MLLRSAIVGAARLANFRLGYVSTSVAAARRTRVRIMLAGVDASRRIRRAGLTIRDVINDTPDSASFTVDTIAPSTEQSLRITIDSDHPRRLFNGTVQTVDLSVDALPTQFVWSCVATDDSARANRKRPFGTFVSTSATTIAQWLASLLPGFTSLGVQANLPAVSIIFDGSESWTSCLARLANAIGGYCYIEDLDVHLFQTEPAATPLTAPIASAVAGTGLPAGTYYYGYTHRTAIGESALSPLGGSFIAAPASLMITGILPGPVGTTDRALYRTTLAGGPPLQLLHLFGDNVTTTFLDVYDDTSLGVAAPSVDTSGLPLNPDPIDVSHPFLEAPPIVARVDTSQLRTRVYGKGHGETTPADVLAAETIVPVADAVMFAPTGGQAIAGTTPDGAQSQILTYTGVQLGGGGSLVGPGATPSGPPVLTLAAGAGLGTGVYGYAYTDVTAAGESLPGPIASITTGAVAAPGLAPTPATPVAGAGLDVGDHDYVVSYTTAGGETLPGPISASVTVAPITAPPAPTVRNDTGVGVSDEWNGWDVGDTVEWAYSYGTASGQVYATTPSPSASLVSIANTYGYWYHSSAHPSPDGMTLRLTYSSDVRVTRLFVFYRINGGSWAVLGQGSNYIFNNPAGSWVEVTYATPFFSAQAYSAPTNPTWGQVTVSGLPIGPAGTTGRKLYRRFNGATSFLLAATIANNVDTSVLDTVANGSLGAAALSVATATVNQVALSGIALGAAAVTSRKVYRTVLNGAQLKLQQTIANNTATVGVTDATADGSLGANVPTSDTSGLTQPDGQVNAGSVSIVTASPAPFIATGGWAILAGGQVIRYTGITGNTLTGLPATGPGAITTTVLYGSQVIPAPALTGVSGLALAMQRGTPVSIWVQRDDLAAQASLVALEAAQGRVSDGVVEFVIADERRGEASLRALCDVSLQMFSRPIVTVTYDTRDVKTKSGKPIVVTLTNPPIRATLVIQEVTISEIDIADGVAPRFHVTASSTRFSLEDLLRRMTALLGA